MESKKKHVRKFQTSGAKEGIERKETGKVGDILRKKNWSYLVTKLSH